MTYDSTEPTVVEEHLEMVAKGITVKVTEWSDGTATTIITDLPRCKQISWSGPRYSGPWFEHLQSNTEVK